MALITPSYDWILITRLVEPGNYFLFIVTVVGASSWSAPAPLLLRLCGTNKEQCSATRTLKTHPTEIFKCLSRARGLSCFVWSPFPSFTLPSVAFYFLLFHKFVSLLHLALSSRGAHATSISVISTAARCVVGGLLEFSVTDDEEIRPWSWETFVCFFYWG